MIFPVMGTIYQSTRMAELSMRWQQRKSDPTMPKKDEDPQMARLREDAERVRKSNIVASIDAKLFSGAELTDEELRYLKVHHPDLYQEAMEIRQERRQYEKALKSCKSKEEVRQLNFEKTQQFLSAARTISSNPNIPRAEKLNQLDKISKRAMGIQNEHRRFLNSRDYSRLPEEDEKRKKKQQEHEADIPNEKEAFPTRAEEKAPQDESSDDPLQEVQGSAEKTQMPDLPSDQNDNGVPQSDSIPVKEAFPEATFYMPTGQIRPDIPAGGGKLQRKA